MSRRAPRRRRAWIACAVLAAAVAPGARLAAQSAAPDSAPLTLDEALREARAHNAQLPVASLALQGAIARLSQARGLRYPTLSLDGDLHGGAPAKYASNDALFRVLAQAPLYLGGALRAGVAQAGAEADAMRAGYRVAVRDVDFAVRVAYGRVVHAQRSLEFRERGVARLRAYLSVVESRRAAGQGVGADLLTTRQRLATTEADIATVQRDLDEARMALNDLLGRAPLDPLALAPLAAPAPPPDTSGEPWSTAPDLAQSEAQVRAASAGVQVARAGRKPQLLLQADAGVQPLLGGQDLAPLDNGRGWGGQILLLFSLPFWDHGVYRGRVDEATAALDQARQQQRVMTRAARLAWSSAYADVVDLYREYQARDQAATVARDAYLQAESLYRGGQGTALLVLDAYDAWVQADQSRIDVDYGYRVAEANLMRWGTP